MSSTPIPAGYRSPLSLYETQAAIDFIKRDFSANLCSALNLKRVSAPLFVEADTGLNDDLNGVERPVSFDIRETGGGAQVVHSLAKWKRVALGRYGFPMGEGLYTDMNAIRRDEELTNLHSIYVDQWDWEVVLSREQRTLDTLAGAAQRVVSAAVRTLAGLKWMFPRIALTLTEAMAVVSAQQLEDMYPGMTPKQRENAYLREHKTALITGIGGKLANGAPHDGRAPDYDDWSLNGDILFWNELLGCAFELSSMGVRVDEASLREQLELAGCKERAALPFHSQLLAGRLPLTMGGGIGQSRLCMLLLQKAHIGEVQSSIWDGDTLRTCEKAGITLL